MALSVYNYDVQVFNSIVYIPQVVTGIENIPSNFYEKLPRVRALARPFIGNSKVVELNYHAAELLKDYRLIKNCVDFREAAILKKAARSEKKLKNGRV